MNNNQQSDQADCLNKIIKDKKYNKFQLKKYTNSKKYQEPGVRSLEFTEFPIKSIHKNTEHRESKLETEPLQRKKSKYKSNNQLQQMILQERNSHQFKNFQSSALMNPICPKPAEQLQQLKFRIKSMRNEHLQFLSRNSYKVSSKIKDKYKKYKHKIINPEPSIKQLTQCHYNDHLDKQHAQPQTFINAKIELFQQSNQLLQIKQQKINRYNQKQEQQILRKHIKNSIHEHLKWQIRQKCKKTNDQAQSPDTHSYYKEMKKSIKKSPFKQDIADTLSNRNNRSLICQQISSSKFITINRLLPKQVQCTNNDDGVMGRRQIIHKNAEEYINYHKSKHYMLSLQSIQEYQKKCLVVNKARMNSLQNKQTKKYDLDRSQCFRQTKQIIKNGRYTLQNMNNVQKCRTINSQNQRKNHFQIEIKNIQP